MSALLDPRREERSLQVADMTDNVVLIHNSISCTHGMRMFKRKYEVSSKLFGFWTLHSELHNTSGTNKKRRQQKDETMWEKFVALDLYTLHICMMFTSRYVILAYCGCITCAMVKRW